MKPLNHSFQNYREIATRNEHVYAICWRSEVAGDVISSENVIESHALLNFEAAIIGSFLRKSKSAICVMFEPYIQGQREKCLIGYTRVK